MRINILNIAPNLSLLSPLAVAGRGRTTEKDILGSPSTLIGLKDPCSMNFCPKVTLQLEPENKGVSDNRFKIRNSKQLLVKSSTVLRDEQACAPRLRRFNNFV